MADREWLQHLATARLVDGGLKPSDEEALSATVYSRIGNAIQDLRALAEDYAEALTEISQARINVRVLEVAAGDRGDQGPGFIMLLGRHQLCVRRQMYALTGEISMVQDFERQVLGSAVFEPKTDSFGSLLWRSDNALLMTSDLIIKRLFEQLIKAARTTTSSEG
jgi:hypothetical protein